MPPPEDWQVKARSPARAKASTEWGQNVPAVVRQEHVAVLRSSAEPIEPAGKPLWRRPAGLLALGLRVEVCVRVDRREGREPDDAVPADEVVGPAGYADVANGIVNRDRPAVEGEAPAVRVEVKKDLLAASTQAEMDDRPVLGGDVDLGGFQHRWRRVDKRVADLSDSGHHARSVYSPSR